MKSTILAVIAGMALAATANAQTIGTFVSVDPQNQNETFIIPSSHAFQLLIKAGDPLTAGGTMPVNSDFTGYFPINGSSQNGYLAVNSEFVPGGVTILDLNYLTTTQLWQVTQSQAVDFSGLGNFLVAGTVANCSGGITPWGTLLTCEENDISGDLTGDGYTDWGWVIEVDPATRMVIDQNGNGSPDKLWAMGRFKHENVAVDADGRTAYEGEDLSGTGYVFKFVADTVGNLSEGALYVLQQNGTNGTWIQVPNTSQSDRNNTISLSTGLGATPFNRVEDVEIGPDGLIYFASTGQGKVFRFRDNGTTISDFETFVDNQPFSIQYAGGMEDVTFSGADNLAFDCEGNLWVQQDGGGKHIWVVGPTHTSSNPDIRIFANTPLDSEPTGITFSPDCKFMFMSLQHPDNGNSVTTLDAAGNPVRFNRDATIVIARSEFLGTPTAIAQPNSAQSNSLNLFPNPAQDRLYMEWEGSTQPTIGITIHDALGREVASQVQTVGPQKQVVAIPIGELSKGIYTLKVSAGNQTLSGKFIKE